MLFVALVFILCIGITGCDKQDDMEQWLGKYVYSESCSEQNGPFMVMQYTIQIYKQKGEYYADIEIVGQTTLTYMRAKVYGDEEWISIIFDEYTAENITDLAFEESDMLVSMRRDGNTIYTYWSEMEPLLLQTKSGDICFVWEEK